MAQLSVGFFCLNVIIIPIFFLEREKKVDLQQGCCFPPTVRVNVSEDMWKMLVLSANWPLYKLTLLINPQLCLICFVSLCCCMFCVFTMFLQRRECQLLNVIGVFQTWTLRKYYIKFGSLTSFFLIMVAFHHATLKSFPWHMNAPQCSSSLPCRHTAACSRDCKFHKS